MSFKNTLMRYTPGFVLANYRNLTGLLSLAPNVLYDMKRFFRYSGMNKSRGYMGEQAARITMAYHQLEKGLSMAVPRPGFGKEPLERLLTRLDPFIRKYGLVPPATNSLAVLDAYMEFNEKAGLDMSELRSRVDKLRVLDATCAERQTFEGGVVTVARTDLDAARAIDFGTFFNTRYSVRHFSGLPIPITDIEQAVKLSQKTPSVCNRQAWKVHAYTDPEQRTRLLAVQKGNRGFGEQASAVLLVTCDLTRFANVGERYQAWIDGGMFSMSLCLAFHWLGYGTCCLNWSKERHDDLALRRFADIQPEEQVIMMIAVGTLPESFRVAYSPRRPLDEVLAIH